MFAYMLLVAAAANPTTTPPADPAQAPAKKERMICKSDKFVGSHLTQRICKTESEWRAGKQNAQDALDRQTRDGKYYQPTGPN